MAITNKMEFANHVVAKVMGLQLNLTEIVILMAVVTVKIILKEKRVTFVRMDSMETIANHVAVMKMVLIQAKIENVIVMMVIVNVGLVMKENNASNVKMDIICQTQCVLIVIAILKEANMVESVITMANALASLDLVGKHVILALINTTKVVLVVNLANASPMIVMVMENAYVSNYLTLLILSKL